MAVLAPCKMALLAALAVLASVSGAKDEAMEQRFRGPGGGVTGLESCTRHDECKEGMYCFYSYDGRHSARQQGYCFAEMDVHLPTEHPPVGGVSAELLSEPPLDLSMLETMEGLGEPDVIKFNPTGLKVSSLTVQAPEGKSAQVVLGAGAEEIYTLGVNKDGLFQITQGEKAVLTVTGDGEVIARTKMLAAAQLQADAGFVVGDEPQWAMVQAEDFSASHDGWKSDNAAKGGEVGTSQCKNGLFMLGGYKVLAQHKVTKTFTGLPKHNRLQLRATYHFIDQWDGQTGYASMSVGANNKMEYVWTETYDVADYNGLIDVCGDQKIGEGRFASQMEVSVSHSADSVTVEFGSTLDNPATSSNGFYGVSNVEILLRGIEECNYDK